MGVGNTFDVIRLHEEFVKSKKSYIELAAETGIDRRHLSDILNGKRRRVSSKTLAIICEAFNLPMNVVLIEGQRGVDEYNIMRGLKDLSDEQVYWVKEFIMELREEKGKRRFCDT